MYEIEIILNNRPLIFTYENPNDPVLTPIHLLFVRRLNLQVIDSKEEETIDICSRYKDIQNLIEHFIKRWENEYLIELREFHKTKSNKKDKRANQIPNVGDVVLIHEENTSKMNFKLGIIYSFKPYRDGAKRIANELYVIDGKNVYVQRPSLLLYPVECNNNETEVEKQLPPFHMEYLLFIVIINILGIFSRGGCYDSLRNVSP